MLRNVIAMALVVAALPAAVAAQATSDTERVAIYDSRAIAVAYFGSALHRAESSRLADERKKARESGDSARMAKADQAIENAQKAMHRQGFGSSPVDNILNQIPEEVARIRKLAGASRLISKWDPVLARISDAQRVDVTDQLVDALKPTDKQRRYVKDLQKSTPVPTDVLEELIRNNRI